MYRAESVIHAALLLLSVFGHDDSTKARKPRFVGYDRACDLAPCIRNLIARQALPPWAAEFFKGMLFVVDRMHVVPHTEACCDINSSDCEYHPDMPKFNAIRETNTQICEQHFRWFNLLKANTRVMCMERFWWFVHIMVEEKNERREEELHRRGMFTAPVAPVAQVPRTDVNSETFEADDIRSKMLNVTTGEIHYVVKWKGYVRPTVELASRLQDCQFLLEQFEN
jgi:hypothetical protein